MATIQIMRQWPDGDVLSIRVKVDDSFPDVIREAVRATLDAYTEAITVGADEETE